MRYLGADVAVDGHRDDVRAAARTMAPDGIDAALVLVGGEGANDALKEIRAKGRVAYPNGVEPLPIAPEGVTLFAYDGTPAPEAFDRLNRLIGPDPFHVELGRVYALGEAAEAHRALAQHYLGKLALKVHRTARGGLPVRAGRGRGTRRRRTTRSRGPPSSRRWRRGRKRTSVRYFTIL